MEIGSKGGCPIGAAGVVLEVAEDVLGESYMVADPRTVLSVTMCPSKGTDIVGGVEVSIDQVRHLLPQKETQRQTPRTADAAGAFFLRLG